VSPDGRRLAVTTWEADKHYLGVCDVATGKLVLSSEGRALASSPDGRWLAVQAADEKTVLLLDAQSHEVHRRLEGHEAPVNCAPFSPDNRLLATSGADRTVRVWDMNSRVCQVLRGHTDEVFAMAFHPNGTRLATAGRDQAIWLWDPARGEEVARLPGHTSYVWSLAFSPDGKTLASGSGDSTVRLWDTEPLRERYRARREAEALRPEAERLVERLFAEKQDAADVADAVRMDLSLSDARSTPPCASCCDAGPRRPRS
jgi:WD40 repeat protein